MHLLALDPATSMGVARWRSPNEIWSGVEVLEGRNPAERLHHARDYLRRKVVAFEQRGEPIDAIYTESFRIGAFRGGGSQAPTNEFLLMLQGVILEVGAATGVPVFRVDHQRWRKRFFGFGTKKDANWKKLAVERCRFFGWSPANHDAAEALGVLYYARCQPEHDPRFGAESADLFMAASNAAMAASPEPESQPQPRADAERGRSVA